MSTVYASTACLPGFEPLEQRLDKYAAEGIFDVELGAGVEVANDAWRARATAGYRFLIHNYFPPPAKPFVLNLASPDEAVRTRSIEHAVNGLSLSASLGAPFYSVHAGFAADPVSFGTTSFVFPPVSADERTAALARFVTSVDRVLDTAERLGVELAIENNVCPPDLRGKLLLQSAEEFAELLDGESQPRPLGILLDTGHLNVTAHTFDFDRRHFIETVAADVIGIHLHDNSGAADTHQPVAADSWIMPILREAKWRDIPIVVEAHFASAPELRRHLDWLKAELGRD